MIDVRIYQSSVIWNIRFGTTVTKERERILRMARKYAIQQRLIHERINIVQSGVGYSQWNEQEKQFLLTMKNEHYNSIDNPLRADYHYSINELAEDLYNIVFKRSIKS